LLRSFRGLLQTLVYFAFSLRFAFVFYFASLFVFLFRTLNIPPHQLRVRGTIVAF
jgi:hypothetical protein